MAGYSQAASDWICKGCRNVTDHCVCGASDFNPRWLAGRWVFWLDKTKPDPDDPNAYRVSVVFENRSGHYPTGGEVMDKRPWYWDEATCRAANAERGYSVLEEFEVVGSSMFHVEGGE
jgi:hypothetical protein